MTSPERIQTPYDGTVAGSGANLDPRTAVGARAKQDILFFCREILGVTPDKMQEKILIDIGRENRIAAHTGHGIGKTAMGSWTLLWFMFTRGQSKVITTAPTWRQVKDLLWTEVNRWARRMDLEKMGWVFPYDLLTTRLNITGQAEWYATGESSDDPYKLEGYHAKSIMYIVDEAKGVQDSIFDAIEGGMTAQEAKMVLLSTPGDSQGMLYRVCSGRENRNMDPTDPDFWHIHHVSAEDSPQVSKRWIETRKKRWGPQSGVYILRVKGEFVELGDDTLFPAGWVDKAVDREEFELGKRSARVLGVDVARYGADSSVVCLREGANAVRFQKFDQLSTVQLADRVETIARDFKPREIWVDADGLGAGVVDILREVKFLRDKIREFHGNATPHDTAQFYNKRVETYWGLRKKFEMDAIKIPDDDNLLGQLTSLKYKYQNKSVEGESLTVMIAESKEDRRRRGLESPDEADALMMAFAGDIEAANPGVGIWF